MTEMKVISDFLNFSVVNEVHVNMEVIAFIDTCNFFGITL